MEPRFKLATVLFALEAMLDDAAANSAPDVCDQLGAVLADASRGAHERAIAIRARLAGKVDLAMSHEKASERALLNASDKIQAPD